jgi:hypothetical protein
MMVPISEWTQVFVIFPKRTITGKKIFLEKAYYRQVWTVYGDRRAYTGPESQYATLFEVMCNKDRK